MLSLLRPTHCRIQTLFGLARFFDLVVFSNFLDWLSPEDGRGLENPELR
jgi:hypothetical protein